MGLSWLLLAVGVGAQPTDFQIHTDTPDALCPELSITRDAVKKRLGELEVDGGGTWKGRYSTVHDPSGRRGDYVRLIIVDPAGQEQAERELPMQGESCATMAQAIALVVDGFFRDLSQLASRETAPAPAPSASAASAPVAPPPHDLAERNRTPQLDPDMPTGTVEPRKPSRSDQSAPTIEGLGIIAGAGYESVPASTAFVFGWFVAITPRWRLELTSSLPTARVNQTYGNAVATLYPIPSRLSFSSAFPISPRLSLFVGPEALVSFERGATRGIPNGHSGWRASFGLGAKAGVAYWLFPWLALAGHVSADAVLVRSRRFLVVDDPAVELSRARLAGGLELWGAIFP